MKKSLVKVAVAAGVFAGIAGATYLVAGALSGERAPDRPTQITVAGPDGKPIVAADGTVVTVTDAQLEALAKAGPKASSVPVIVTPEIAAQYGLSADYLGTELVAGENTALWEIIGTHPMSQQAVDAILEAHSKASGG